VSNILIVDDERAGAKACLTKPLDVQQVLSTIEQLITEGVSA